MPVYTDLWSINNYGKVFTLSSHNNCWSEKKYCGLEFKRLSTCSRCTWAIGGDHQIYIYVNHSDVPIRVKEEAYENQRWNPYESFTNRLLPSDRPTWSSEDGSKPRYKDRICLPNNSWQWESPWYLENSIDGQPLGKEGWTYAVDFPRPYTKVKKWNSCVRRRKWLRHRKFMAMDSWTMIPGVSDDPTSEPFIDIAIGGTDIPGGDAELYSVWGVTILGQVFFRDGVTITCPEGVSWHQIPTQPDCNVSQISVGPTGIVWAVNWDGDAIVRIGVNRNCVTGTGWRKINSDSKLEMVSVGINCVWAICRDHNVWFRSGIDGRVADETGDAAVGTNWIQMVGLMAFVAVGMNDQVFAIGHTDRDLYFRTGVTYNELNGRTWKRITLPVSSSLSINSESDLSLNSHTLSCDADESINNEKDECSTDGKTSKNHSVRFSLSKNSSSHTSLPDTNSSLTNNRKYSCPSGLFTEKKSNSCNYLDEDSDIYSSRFMSLSVSVSNEHCNENEESSDKLNSNEMRNVSENEDSSDGDDSNCNISSTLNPAQDDDVFSASQSIDQESEMCISENVDSVLRSETENWNRHEDRMQYDYDQSKQFNWCWLCPRACSINPQSLPNWFSLRSTFSENCLNQVWRMNIMTQFESRYDNEMKNFVGKYEEAIDKAKWVKTSKCKVYSESRSCPWAEGTVELERSSDRNDLDMATLTCSYHVQHRVELMMSEVTCILNTLLPTLSGLSIYTAKRIKKQMPLKLSFRSDSEREDWLASLHVACFDLRKMKGDANENSAFVISATGEVYAHTTMQDMETASCNQMFWKCIGGGHLAVIESSVSGVVWGIGYDNSAWVYSRGYGGGPFKGISGYNSKIHPMHDTMRLYIYENQRWNPLTGFSMRSLPTDRYQWSDRTGLFECTKTNTKLPSIHWTWSTDWSIDYNVPGGVDDKGWQYAYDFPRVFHGQKSFTDYVRRRRWYRECKLSTSGPWKELESIQLIDVSIQVDYNPDNNHQIAVWGIAENGDVLCRLGVTSLCPEGLNWVHVSADQPFRSISVGGNYQVWAVARDGSAFLRHGIRKDNFIGDVWFHLELPTAGVPLKQISCGVNTVLAIDSANKLWYRQEIMPHFPEGTNWKLICDNILNVSVGPLDQIWAIANTYEISQRTVNGIICRRTGISKDNPIGTSWDYGMSGGWQYISVRACRPDLEKKIICLEDDIKPTFGPHFGNVKQKNNDTPIC